LASQLVVVVDNSATNLKILGRLVMSLGEAVAMQAFADPVCGAFGLRGAETRPLVVAGDMAQLDIAAFIGQLRAEKGCAEVPVIVVAAYDEREYIDRALAAGAADHLLSPIDHLEFRTRARNLLSLRRYERAAREEETSRGSVELPHAHERLLRVIDAVPAMVCATDGDGRYIFCNQRFASFVGLRPGRLIGRRPLEAHDDALARRLADLDARLLSGEILPNSFEDEIVDRDGNFCDLLTTKSVYHDGDGTMVVTVSLDITARKRAELDLIAVKEQAEIGNRSKTEFLANMSHELRTPLNAIIGFSQVMAGEMLGPIASTRYVGYSRDILASAEHLLGIINDILDVSKLETGKLELVEEIIDLPKAIGDLITLVEGKAKAADIKLVARHGGRCAEPARRSAQDQADRPQSRDQCDQVQPVRRRGRDGAEERCRRGHDQRRRSRHRHGSGRGRAGDDPVRPGHRPVDPSACRDRPGVAARDWARRAAWRHIDGQQHQGCRHDDNGRLPGRAFAGNARRGGDPDALGRLVMKRGQPAVDRERLCLAPR
jgi:PAS domain S-box-containing protein